MPWPSQDRRRHGGRSRWAIAAVAAAATSIPLTARAAEKDWNPAVGSGNWTTPGNWAQGVIPAALDTVFIVNNDATNRIVTFDYTGGTVFQAFRLDNVGGGTNALLQNSNTLSAGYEAIGVSGIGIYTQNGGTDNVIGSASNALFVGSNVTGFGTYNLNGGLLNDTQNGAFIGYSGNGVFNQSGGTHSVGSVWGLYIGYNTTASGTYTLSGSGVLNVPGEVIGYLGQGTFTQSGGTHAVNGNLNVGFAAGSSGTFTLSGGTLGIRALEIIGYSGSGVFNQGGGVHNVSGTNVGNGILYLGYNSGAVGAYTLSGGSLAVGSTEYIGVNTGASGTFTQTDGTHTANILYLGSALLSSGTFTLSGGTLGTSLEYLGYNGGAVFNQSGGVHSVSGTNALYLGYNSGAVGAYTLSGGSLSVSNAEDIGYNGGASGTFTQTDGTNMVGDLNLGYSTNSTGNYNLSGGTLNVTQVEKVGLSGNSTFNQSAGTHTVGIGLQLGGNWGVSGTQRGTATYNMSGGTLSIGTPTGPGAAGFLSVAAHDDNGFFNQSGGTVIINGKPAPVTWPGDGLFIGLDVGTSGTYNLSNGATLIVNSDEFIGTGGNGTFNQSGGVHTVTGPNGIFLGDFISGTNPADITTGLFNLSGGTVSTPNIYVGGGYPNSVTNTIAAVGYGNLTVTGGTLNVAGTIQVFNTSNSAGTFSSMTLSGGTVSASAINLPYWGLLNFAGGTLNLTGGVSSNSGAFTIGTGGSTAATLNLSGGSVYVNGFEYIGLGVAGTFNQTAGVHNVLYLHVAEGPGVSGTYNLVGGSINDVGDERIATYGIGAFVQSGGNNTVTGNNFYNSYGLGIGENAGANGSYTLIAGTLDISNSEFIGSAGLGTFSQTNGAHNVGSGSSTGGSLYLGGSGLGSGGAGTYFLSGGILNVHDAEYIGYNGAGQMIQSGGYHTAGGTAAGLYLGYSAGSSGTYTLSGAGTLSVPGSETIGYTGTGVFNQSGGVNSAGSLSVEGASGTYNLSGGSLQTTGETIGYFGNGVFNQSGGTHTTGQLNLGAWGATSNQTGTGAYNLSGGSLIANAVTVAIWPDAASFTQTGGTHQVATLTIGNLGMGTYNLSGNSTLVVSGSETLAADYGSLGTLNQSGGAHAVNGLGGLAIGAASGGTGIVNLTGGVLSASSVYVGGNSAASGGLGILNVGSNALLTVNGTLKVWHMASAATASTTVNLMGGTIVAGAIDLDGVPASLQWAGGAIQLTNSSVNTDAATNALFGTSLTLDPTRQLSVAGNYTIGGFGTGAVTLAGGSLTVAGSIQLNLGGTLTQSAGKLRYGFLVQNGGTLTNDLVNQSTFTYAGGAFLGRLVNQAFVNLSADFAPGNGVENDYQMFIPAGITLTANGLGFDNEGSFVLGNGGTLAGSGIVNNGAFTAAGGGAINAPMSNFNALTIIGPVNLGSSLENFGVMNVPLEGNLRQGSVDNWGVIALAGGDVSSPINNQTGGTIQGGGNLFGAVMNGAGATIFANSPTTPLMLSGFLANAPGGQLRIAAGSTLNVTNAWTNNCLVTLLGAGANLGGSPLGFTNVGTVKGAGLIGPPVFNAGGVIRAENGELDLAAAGNTNSPTGQFQAPAGGTVMVLQGLATNLGTITLSGGAFDNNNFPLNNPGQILGGGIFRSGGLVNSGSVYLSDLDSSVYGPVTNAGSIRITANTTTFYGFVNNASGTIKTTAAVARYLGGASVGGVYVSDPSDNYFSDLAVTATGALQGGAGDRFLIGGNYTSSSTQSARWNTLGAELRFQGAANHMLGVGGPAGTYEWGALTVDPANAVTVSGPAGVGVTATAVNLSTTSKLDLASHALLTSSSPATIKSHLARAYTANQDWSGSAGITSSLAAANPDKYSLAYASGSDGSAQDAGINVAPGRVLVKPVLAGDANMDGTVDFFDISQVLGYKYNTGQQASYTDGDLNYDGVVNFFDLAVILSGNYNTGETFNAAAAHATPSLTGALHHASTTGVAIASSTTIGAPGDGKPDFEYNPITGDLRFRSDGGTFTTTGGSASFVSSLTISSASGILLGGGASAAFAGGTGATLTSTLLSSALTNSPGFSDGFDIGIVLAPGLNAATLTADLTVKYQSLNGGSLKTADITVPEPAAAAVLGVGAGLLLRRRKRRSSS
jgi:hypothetical protein